MNKGKFASLIMLGAFSAGVASSSAVSAQGDINLASVVDNKSASSHDDSVSIDPKVSNEPMVDADETNIDAETTTDEETQDVSPDDNSDAGINAKNIDDNPENKTDLPENLDKEDNKNRDYLFVDKTKKVKKVNLAKGLAIAAGGGAALGGATFGISKLVKSSGYEKKDEPSPETNPESDKPTDSKEEEKEPEKKEEPSPETNPESDKPTGSEEEEKEPEKKEEPSPETNPESDKPTDSKKEEKEPDKKDEPSPETSPESDKPTGSEEEEKEPEKNPSEKPKEEEKGGFVYRFWTWYKNNLGVSIPLTIYISWIIGCVVGNEVKQRSKEYDDIEKGIFFDLVENKKDRKEEANIKPFGGLWGNFTNKNLFNEDEKNKGYTVKYKGFERVAMNALAAATFAKYEWYSLPKDQNKLQDE